MLSIRNLTKIYANGVHALATLNLQISQGEIVASSEARAAGSRRCCA